MRLSVDTGKDGGMSREGGGGVIGRTFDINRVNGLNPSEGRVDALEPEVS